MHDERPTHLDLFSGIGGFAIAAERCGWETIAFCEREKFAQRVLRKHWPSVPIIDDIHDLDGREYRGVSLLTGGFPCQPFSQAGQQRGAEDDRAIWPEMLRVITEARPRFVVGENVAGIINMALDDVLSSLETASYSVGAVIVPACAVDAKHRRERVWILGADKLADPGCKRPKHRDAGELEKASGRKKSGGDQSAFRVEVCGSDVADPGSEGLQRPEWGGETRKKESPGGHATKCGKTLANTWSGRRPGSGQPGIAFNQEAHRERQADESLDGRVGQEWPTEPDVGRVAHGIPERSHRLRGLGNAIVPQVAEQVLMALIESER